jgi:hypothetical protein
MRRAHAAHAKGDSGAAAARPRSPPHHGAPPPPPPRRPRSNAIHYPLLQPLPADFVATMEEYAKDAPRDGTGGAAAKQVRARLARLPSRTRAQPRAFLVHAPPAGPRAPADPCPLPQPPCPAPQPPPAKPAAPESSGPDEEEPEPSADEEPPAAAAPPPSPPKAASAPVKAALMPVIDLLSFDDEPAPGGCCLRD